MSEQAEPEDVTPETLTGKQRRFVEEYLVDFNGAQAAIRAGYSAKTARDIACENLAKPNIKAAVEAGTKRLTEEAEVRAFQVLRELATVAFSDPTDYEVDASSGAITPDQSKPDAWRAVSSVKRKFKNTPGGTEVEVEFRLWPKVEALKLLGQRLGMFPDRHEITGKDGAPLPTIIEVVRPHDDPGGKAPV